MRCGCSALRRGRKLSMPALVLWGSQDVIASLFDCLADWREVADNVAGRALDRGHFVSGEALQATLVEVEHFLRQHPIQAS